MEAENLREKIKSVNPALLNERIKKWDGFLSHKLLPFVSERYWHGNASINVFRVVGTEHPDYSGLSWVEFLEKGKRMGLNLGLYKENPHYYYDAKKKEPPMYYRSLDGGDLYIGEDGNHRTCIAKADFYLKGLSTLHGVVHNDYRIKWELKRVFDELSEVVEARGVALRIEPGSEIIAREDSGEWMREIFENFLIVRDLKKGTTTRLNGEEAERFLERTLKRRGFWRLW